MSRLFDGHEIGTLHMLPTHFGILIVGNIGVHHHCAWSYRWKSESLLFEIHFRQVSNCIQF